ncbi:MAG: flagellar hook-associated protein FlgK [Nitrosomonas sp.]|uniref:flagellar hook-associated protein FlgK n=1 Tax=Nitrosomonas sp. TaxID=42353 RepID=UPI002731F665|nr:flagellar hook-associated protein FlgK [Nitrosomonas sp.]MDP1550378.1 flagellar hook-associated protein FlgK [Nitrosomonas sp.]MDP1935013.1 flagellar hook-associated protein FlgK [Nitrosomonas sp.]MDP3280374.1 flagellar hook-associated protein FlgK [Nitrosomonas sp.]MDP3664998.1 flagellar hook-associated protein FlgK [Nitrosomonas sp.]MDZ4107315.1 flagellar hook-associated protein FlgK [Nitrosomonas sp.]
MGNSILDIGITGLLTAQRQLLTTGHNISNADTPGYKRQQVVLSTNIPQSSGAGFVGRGVHSTTVQRIYNQFVVSQSLQIQTQSQAMDSYFSQIKQLDNMLGDSSSGLSPAIQNFFSAVQDVATNPSVIPSRQAMISNGEALVARFQSMDQRMAQIREDVNTQITSTVVDINSLASQIADINHQILLAEGAAGGQPANDMQDQRDELISQLNKLVNTDTVRQSDGSVNVYVGSGQALVVGTQTLSFKAIVSPDNPDNLTIGLVIGSNTVQLPENQITGGMLNGVLSFRSITLDSAQNALGRIAITLAQTLNAQHQSGMDLNGDMGGDFFTLPSPKIISALSNNPASSITAGISDYSALTTSDYQFSYDGTNYILTRSSDNTSVSTAVAPTGVSPLTLDGVSVTGATILTNERFRIQPTINGAKDLAVNISDTTKIAAAGPNRTDAALTNTGTGKISAGTVNPLPLNSNLQQPLTITFHTPYDGQYDVAGIGTGLPATNQAYTAGSDISFNGYTFQISGSPAAGDIFTIAPNHNGSADNRNALLMGVLQTKNTLANGTASYQSAYGQLVSQVGNKTRELEVTSKAQATLLKQTENTMQSVSGVNLDEEAANLMRFQQAYQASSKVIEMSNTLFDSILRIG